jgi:hypothetical protein
VGNLVQIRKVGLWLFGFEGMWHFYSFCKKRRKTAKTAGVVCFGDKILPYRLIVIFLNEVLLEE